MMVLVTYDVATSSPNGARRLRRVAKLTSTGSNAEAYWSPDGKRIIFQSTRDGHACDQQYVMGADGSGQTLVSTGKGRTT